MNKKQIFKGVISLRAALAAVFSVVMCGTTLMAEPAAALRDSSEWDEVCIAETSYGMTIGMILGYDLNESGRDFNCDDIRYWNGNGDPVSLEFVAFCHNERWGKLCVQPQENGNVFGKTDYDAYMAQPWKKDRGDNTCLYKPDWSDGAEKVPAVLASNENCLMYGIDWTVDSPNWD